MSTAEVRPAAANRAAGVGTTDLKLEVVVIRVSDVERAEELYGRLGRRLDGEEVGHIRAALHLIVDGIPSTSSGLCMSSPSRWFNARSTTTSSLIARRSPKLMIAVRHSGYDEQCGRVIGTVIKLAVDEQRGRPRNAGGHAIRTITLDSREQVVPAPIPFELCNVEVELTRVADEVAIRQRALAMKEQLVHAPELSLSPRRLRCPGRGKCVRVQVGQRKVTERESCAAGSEPLHSLSRAERLARVRTLVVAVHEQKRRSRRPSHMIDAVLDRSN
jgi:hypothetical protein